MNAPPVMKLEEEDWRAFATLRLRALDDTLGSLDPQYREEMTFTAAQWRRRLRAHAQFVARADGRLVGLIGAQRDTAESVYLYSLWLQPDARGKGLGLALVSAAVEWARGVSARVVTLRVDATNSTARSVYETLGFDVVDVPGKPGEVTMSLKVD